MISDTQNQALLTVGHAAAQVPTYADYAAYCIAREQGLRKVAFRHLDVFTRQAKMWPLNDRIAFFSFLFPYFEALEDSDYGPFPQPLSQQLVKPTLQQWCALEPADARPFRWFGRYYRDPDYLLKALNIDPHDDTARQTLVGWWLYSLYYSVHHLPDGYIGHPEDDLLLAQKIRIHINQLTSPDRRSYWTQELEDDLELVHNYVAWKSSGHPNLVQWGKEYKMRVSYDGGPTYYYQK
jgi:hypothetical protein